MCRAGRAATARWGFHLFRVVDAFLDANQGITLVQAMFREEPAADAGTAASWWPMAPRCGSASATGMPSGDSDCARRPLDTYYGPQSLHELLERTTWHSGQHVRQYMMLLEREGQVAFHRPLVEADFARLPMPQNVWDG